MDYYLAVDLFLLSSVATRVGLALHGEQVKSLVVQTEQLVQASHFDAANIEKKSREISRR